MNFFYMDYALRSQRTPISFYPSYTFDNGFIKILNLDIELWLGYLNPGFICHDLSNKSLNCSDSIYCGPQYFLTDWGEIIYLEFELQSFVI